MAIHTYRYYQPGTFQEQGTRVFERERPQHIAGGERCEICINQIITHITAGIRI